LVSTTVCEVADGVDEIFGKLLVTFEGIIYSVNSVFLALKPLVGQLDQLYVAIEVLGNAGKGLHADLSHLEIVAVATDGYCLENFLEVLLSCLYYFLVT
jgi:hypothetical protein